MRVAFQTEQRKKEGKILVLEKLDDDDDRNSTDLELDGDDNTDHDGFSSNAAITVALRDDRRINHNLSTAAYKRESTTDATDCTKTSAVSSQASSKPKIRVEDILQYE